jgi:hypothetical protein
VFFVVKNPVRYMVFFVIGLKRRAFEMPGLPPPQARIG